MTSDDQEIKGLEAAYAAVFNRGLKNRVAELFYEYGQRVDAICCELNPDNAVPCFWKVSELAVHYGLSEHWNNMDSIPAAACSLCGGWQSQGGMSQHSKAEMPVHGRTGCTGPHMDLNNI